MMPVPHVVVTGVMDIEKAFMEMESVFIREGTMILKTTERYISTDRRSFILEATVIGGKAPVSFLVLVGKRDDGLVVRIHPATDPEKTPAVKRLVAEVALSIIRASPGSSIGKTNLQEYLEHGE